MNRRISHVLLLTGLLIASGALVSAIWRYSSPDVQALVQPPSPAIEASPADPDDPPNTFAFSQPITSAKPGDPPGYTRVPAPKAEGGARRIGIQIGHWQTDNVPSELRRLEVQTGTSWNGLSELDVSIKVANLLADLLRSHGYLVDLIPTTVPSGYLADTFVSLHMDGDGTGENSGYKLAHGSRRGPYEQQLLDAIKDEYGAATGLRWDPEHISRAMVGFYGIFLAALSLGDIAVHPVGHPRDGLPEQRRRSRPSGGPRRRASKRHRERNRAVPVRSAVDGAVR